MPGGKKPRSDLRLSGDRPIEKPEQDCLGYATFAEGIAKALAETSRSDEVVVAIYGKWGSGKTSVLNLIEHHLLRIGKRRSRNWIITVRFNPWWFSGREDLARQFFENLGAQFQNAKDDNIKKAKVITSKVGHALSVASSGPMKHLGQVLKLISDQPTPSVQELKAELAEKLLESPTRTIVLIDDVDRITGSELVELFAVIKGLADLPRVSYVLAMERGIAEKQLSGSLDLDDGGRFLEKIVQLPFDLPLPDADSLLRMLDERLALLVRETPDDLFDSYRWSILRRHLAAWIATPRDLFRIVNALCFTYPPVRSEVAFPDFFAIEMLRLFQPEVYDLIRKNPQRFAGELYQGYGLRGEEGSGERDFHKAWVSRVAEAGQGTVTAVVAELFPRVARWFDIVIINPVGDWGRKRLVCSEECFDVYFRYSVPESGYSRNVMLSYISALEEEPQSFCEELLLLSTKRDSRGASRLSDVIGHLIRNYLERTGEETRRAFCHALLSVGDELVAAERIAPGPLEQPLWMSLKVALLRVIRSVDEQARHEFIANLVADAQSVGIMSALVREFVSFGARESEVPPLLTDDTQKQVLGRQAVDRIKQSADDGSLQACPLLLNALFLWGDFEESGPVSWVRGVASRDDGMMAILRSTVYITFDESARPIPTFEIQSLTRFLDLEEVEARVRRLLQDSADDADDSELLGAFLNAVASDGS